MFKIFIAASVIYGFYCAAAFFLQRPVLFPVSHIPVPDQPEFKNGTVEIQWIETDDCKVESWYLPPQSGSLHPPYPLIIFAHGNAELIDYALPEMIPFTRLGFGVLLVEYPGYGRSTGTPSQKSITKAMIAAYDTITQRPDIDKTRIILFGRSLGGGAVCQLAAQRDSAAMILVSTFTSVSSFTSSYMIPGFVVRDPFDNLAVVRAYDHPILFFHGTYDDIVPYNLGVKLSGAAHSGTLITYNCGHNDLPPDRVQYMNEIAHFLKQNGIILSDS
jgi:dipeptidyl aminopeptidase/acylaminoacyl peptidase